MDGLWFLPNAMQVLLHRSFTKEDLVGEWEIIRIQEPPWNVLEAGQILWGEGDLRNGEQALSAVLFWKQMAVLEMQLGILMLKNNFLL